MSMEQVDFSEHIVVVSVKRLVLFMEGAIPAVASPRSTIHDPRSTNGYRKKRAAVSRQALGSHWHLRSVLKGVHIASWASARAP